MSKKLLSEDDAYTIVCMALTKIMDTLEEELTEEEFEKVKKILVDKKIMEK